jgi:hypothetical protein
MKSSRAKASVNIYPDERRSNRAFIDYDPTITYRQAVSAMCGIVGPKSEVTTTALHGNPRFIDYSGFIGWVRYKFRGKQLNTDEERFGEELIGLLDQDCVPECQAPIKESPVFIPRDKGDEKVDGNDSSDEPSTSSVASSSKSKGRKPNKVKKESKPKEGKKKSQSTTSSSLERKGKLPPVNEYIEYTRTRRDKMAVTCAQMARNKFPITQRSEANRLVVRKYIFGLMEQHGLRPQHIRATLDISVSLAFTPDSVDLMVTVFESTQAYLNRQDEYRRPHTTGWFKNLFTWMPKVIPHQGYDRS